MQRMDERAACALLKARFEAAGFQIEENRPFAEAGVEFEIDGYDAARRVGYEYVTSEAGDSWDVDDRVIGVLAEQRRLGELFVLVVDEAAAPDAATLGSKADAFLAEIPPAVAAEAESDESATDDTAPENEPAAKKPAAKTKPATKKTAAKKPATKKPAAKKPAKKAKR
jgi:hypothetical protein